MQVAICIELKPIGLGVLITAQV